MGKETLINKLNELDHVVSVKSDGDCGVFIYTNGRHDRTVQKALFSHDYRIIDISVDPSNDGACYIYAMAEEESIQYLKP